MHLNCRFKIPHSGQVSCSLSNGRPSPRWDKALINWLVEEKGIAPHIPVNDKSQRDDGTFSRSDFQYDRQAISTTARAGSSSGRAARCTMTRRFCIVPAGAIAAYAHSNRSAAQRNHRARSRDTSMPGTRLSLVPMASNSRDVSARRSRCGLHTSSAS
jgi:hypothetical protein